MKDFVFTSKRKKLELWILLGCFLIAFGFNVYSIHTLKAPWSELYTMLPMVLMVTAGIYIFSVVARLALYLIIVLFRLLFPNTKDTINEQS